MARIRERSPGIWEVTVSAGRDPQNGRPTQKSRTVRGSRRVALEAAAALLTEVRDHGSVETKGSVAHLFDAYLDHGRARGLAPKTVIGYELIAKKAAAELGKIELRKLTTVRLDQYYVSLTRRGLTATTVLHHHAFLRGALRQAVRWGWIMRSPADAASPPRNDSLEPSVPSVEDVQSLLAFAKEERPELANLLWVAATTGMRRGELCGLRWSDVDFTRATVVVRRSISDLPGRVEVRPTKTRRVRRIAIDPLTEAVLREQSLLARERAAAAGVGLSPDAYVWSQEVDHSTPWGPDRVSDSFRGMRRRAGLPEVRLHHFRHFAATMMLSNGIDVRTAAGRLGHAEPSVTLKVYAHALEQRDREAAALLAALLQRPKAG